MKQKALFENNKKQLSFGARAKKDMMSNWPLYLIVLPVLAYYLFFFIFPASGLVIAFKDFTIKPKYSYLHNIVASDWVGLKYFKEFFGSVYFGRVLKNTIIISLSTLAAGFPIPILLAIMINEVKSNPYKRLVQTVTYLPHFISLVVVCGMVKTFTSDTGILSVFLSKMTGASPETMLNNKSLFVPIYVLSEVWQQAGWDSIIYLAAITAIDQDQYEAARIDGAGKLRQIWYVTLPGIVPTITIMLILAVGKMLNVGYEKIILLYNPMTKPTAEVISTYTYQRGLIERDWSYATAVGFFNSIINFGLVITANIISRKISDTSLW
ncbi:MAG: sugar ABC transporter permease [Clostridia bacterium]|nr:sugar ABC transporter permease [Clostridia bacterium]